ncbi:MAG TPA: LmbE family protein, partial [Flavobacteriales bacterium]|nr:LmbE family protein [Flavobacteriales bacterium]
QGLQVWQPRRLFFNGSTWWKKNLAEIAGNDPDWYSVDVGGYDPLLGESYTEIAGRSRSMHKSQGFGAAETRGRSLEYLHFEKGERPTGSDLFGGMDLSWGRLQGGTAVAHAVDGLLAGYDLRAPEKSTAAL